VDGRVLVRNRQILHLDVPEIMTHIREIARQIKKRN
jgi:hypothetical protein